MKKILYRLIFESQKVKATDIHFLISNRRNSCEMRGISGFKSFEDEQIEALFQYLKYCANLDLGNLAIPQSGTFQMNFQDKNYYFRFSCISSYQNQTGVLRILNNHPPISIHQCSTKKTQNAQFKRWCSLRSGLILFSGPTGSGKSTTLAAMINEINSTREAHIITLEDPIEYLHKHKSCIINQREIGKDSKSYQNALKAILREDPDVILVGEMRDLETISIAITAAETGHLVFSTLHTIGAAKTIDRIIDVFPPHHQQQIRVQLAAVLQGVISQQLVPVANNDARTSALEIMTTTPGIQNLIREGKTHQIESAIQTGGKYGMKTMDMALAELYKSGIITMETALTYSVDKETIKRIMML